MITAETLRSPAYDEFEAATLKLHASLRGGNGGSAGATGLRGQIAGPWARMTDDQQEFGNDFAGDLYMLHPTQPEMYEPATDEERSPKVLGHAIKAAWYLRDWAAALSLLRRGADFFGPTHIAYLRARAYGELARPAVALAFIRFARRIDPRSVTYRILELDWMRSTSPAAETHSLAWLYVEDAAETPTVALVAAGILIDSVRDSDDTRAQVTLDRLIPNLRRMANVVVAAGGPDPDDTLAVARLQLGACLETPDPAKALANYQAVVNSPPPDADGVILREQLKQYVRQRFGSPSQTKPTANRADLNRILASSSRDLVPAG